MLVDVARFLCVVYIHAGFARRPCGRMGRILFCKCNCCLHKFRVSVQARRHFHLFLHSRERLHTWLSSAHAAAGCDFWGVQGCMGCIGIFGPAHANQFAASFTCETVGCQRLAKTLDCHDLFEHPLGGKKLVGMCRPANASAPKKKFCSSA